MIIVFFLLLVVQLLASRHKITFLFFREMGVCKFHEAWKETHHWAVAVPGKADKARCILCPGKVFGVKSGEKLADFFNLSSTQNLDDLAQLRVTQTVSFSLFELFNKKELDAQAPLMKLVESVFVLCPHNVMVESGFSKMKFFENDYRCNLGLEMHNGHRVIADNFDRDDFEDFESTDSLLESAKASHRRYKEEVDESKS